MVITKEKCAEKLIKRIDALLDEKHFTKYMLCKQSGVAFSTLNNLYVRHTCPSVDTLYKIVVNGFGMTMEAFFAGIEL